MNKLPKTQRQRNYFGSIDRIKKQWSEDDAKERKRRADRVPYSRRSAEEKAAQIAAQKAYDEQHGAMLKARMKAEAEQLKKELRELIKNSEVRP